MLKISALTSSAVSRVKTTRGRFNNCSASWDRQPFPSGTGRTRINVKLTEKMAVTDFSFSGFEVTPGDWERFVNDS